MSDECITPNPDETLIARVRKLTDKAESTSNQHEADAFARKAAELIARHHIEPSRLRSSHHGSHDALSVCNIPLGRGAYVRARLALLSAVARSHEARVVFGSSPSGTTAYVAGFTSDLAVIEALYHSLHTQAVHQMAAVRRGTPAATQRFRRSFLFGYADRLDQLLDRAVSDTRTTAASASTDIALRERSATVDEFAHGAFGRVRTARVASAAQAAGWRAGASAAEGVDVGRRRVSGRRALGSGST